MNKKVISFVLLIVLLMSIVLTGCDKDKAAAGVKLGKNDAGSISVLDIKKKYGVDTEKSMMPLYNVEKNKEFIFNFNYYFETGTNMADIVSVHTDIKCLPESDIHANVWMDSSIKEKKTEVSVKPTAFVTLASEADKANGYDSWGNAPIYYIKLNYDISATEPKKLEKPMIIPFTVKSEAPVPNLRSDIGLDGKFKLEWDSVEGAEKYNVYQTEVITLLETTNKAVNGAEKGYLGVYPHLVTSLTDTKLDYFLSSGSESSFENDGVVSYQNQGVKGEYYVTAVVNGKESNFSRPISTIDLSKKLPKEYDNSLSLETIQSVKDLPKKIQVEYIDGSTRDEEVIYDIEGYNKSEGKLAYSVKGTAFKSYVFINLSDADIAALKASSGTETASGYVEPKNDTDMVPKPDVPTIINDDKTVPTTENVIDAQKENTEKQVEQGNQQVVEAPEVAREVKLIADTALEEYLALKMVNAETEISLKAFPEAQNFDALGDALKKVMYQNPLIIGVKNFKYNYGTISLTVGYNDSADVIKKQQKEIKEEAEKIISSTIKSGMSDEEKRKALYDYLNDNTKYDTAALENAEQNNFKSVDEKFNDSFTTYGIMVKKVGVCASYAATYKMLCDMAGVDCIVVTGTIGGVPHAWNKVKIDNEWVHVDSTNNQTNSGIPYLLYNANDETSVQATFTTNDEYWTDSELSKFAGNTNKYDYYVANHLEVDSIDEYKSAIAEKLKSGEKLIVLRFASKMDQKQMMSATAEVFNSVARDKIDNAKVGGLGNYVVITY